ncbi:helix-turn-helix transcriptional regulator [Algoriphagus sp. H41]|uniref:Helix-turn-helix transcriptional regulator n=1 Tax=Algoriphagus oliviformis TaxID=2811231 RepID=A0ABS3BYP2_9BACT|nr:metalloregulator ArsR/SmtB family transcription factor [Algoriphagus oliviformis]MBN7809989.1 helix-turn-helix transcriptional regulator [Algoriphagus oliviformis]
MGVTQSHLFTEDQNQLALIAKAIAHPARIAIIQHLIKTKSCINGDLVSEIGLAQATISQHLRELKEVGIIQGTIEGTKINYCIHPEKWNELKSLFQNFFESYSACCDSSC